VNKVRVGVRVIRIPNPNGQSTDYGIHGDGMHLMVKFRVP
jgi:hypothetical protein